MSDCPPGCRVNFNICEQTSLIFKKTILIKVIQLIVNQAEEACASSYFELSGILFSQLMSSNFWCFHENYVRHVTETQSTSHI